MELFIISCLLVGALAGFLAGLFGIGGGMVVVPALLFLFPKISISAEIITPLALGTSFSTIIITTLSAFLKHNSLQNINWQVAKIFAPFLIIGALVGSFIAGLLPKNLVIGIFAVILIFLASKMFSQKIVKIQKSFTVVNRIFAGLVIGFISSLAGIAGGALIVPFLNSRGLELPKAIGTSSFCGFCMSVSALLGFIFSGLHIAHLPEYSFGFVYLPATLAIISTSFFTAKIGASLVHRLPVVILKRFFAIFLIVVALDMLLKLGYE